MPFRSTSLRSTSLRSTSLRSTSLRSTSLRSTSHRTARATLLSAALLLALAPLAAIAATPTSAPVATAPAAPGAVEPVDTAQGEVDGFMAIALLTPDPDWEEEWRKPRGGGAPNFRTSARVEDGGELRMLLFFANPQLDANARADVACTVRVTRPDGSVPIDERDTPCFQAVPGGDPRALYLAAAGMGFLSEPSDPRGVWVVDAALTDRVRGVSVPLRVAFEVR